MTLEQIDKAFQQAPPSYRKSTEFEGELVYGDSIFKTIVIEDISIGREDTDNTEFSGNLNLDSSAALEPLKALLGLTGELSVQGSLSWLDTDKPEIDISVALENQPLDFLHLNLEAASIRLFTHYPEDSGLPESRASLNCSATIKDSSISFEFVAVMTELEDTWEFSFQAVSVEDHISLGDGLAVLPKIAGVDSIDDITLPESLKDLLKGLSLARFTINLNPFPSTFKINHLALEVAFSGTWNLIPDVFAIENLELGLLILSPEDDYLIAPYVTGTFILGSSDKKVNLYVEAEFLGGVSATAELQEGDVIPISEAISQFTTLDHLPRINISELLINVEAPDYPFFKGTLETSWKIDLFSNKSIQLEEVSIILERTDGSYSGSFVGKLKITEKELYLSAVHSGADGWQFVGSTGEGESLEIGSFISYLTESFGVSDIPAFINDISLETLHTEFTTQTKNFKFTCEGIIPLEESGSEEEIPQGVYISVNIELTGANRSYDVTFTGKIIIDLSDDDTDDDETEKLIFDLYFQNSSDSKIIIGKLNTTEENPDVDNINLQKLVSQIAPDLGEQLPEELLSDFKLKPEMVLVIDKRPDQKKKLLFSIGIGANIAFNQIPLVQDFLPEEYLESEFGFKLLVALQTFTQEDLETINSLIVDVGLELLDAIKPPSTSQTLEKGASIGAYLKIADFEKAWLLTLKRSTNSPAGSRRLRGTQTSENPQLVTSRANARGEGGNISLTFSENGVWLEIQKDFGPIFFEKVGLVYKEGEIHLTPQFNIQSSQLLLSFNALSISSPLNNFEPELNLDGFGLQLISETLEIGGAFLISEFGEYTEYLGTLTVGFATKKGKALSLSAIGAFADYNNSGNFSLFLYLTADYPFGGPPFFFVTGISGGFGYNRDLIVPPLEEIEAFPLVAQAIGGTTSTDPSDTQATITEQLELIGNYIPPKIGAGWAALGLKFTCCKIIDCFALVTLSIDQNDVELNLLGFGNLIFPITPSGVDPLAMAEIALQARFNPLEGELLVRGQLTPNSYILSPDCKLTGGFAYGLWFAGEHTGDFVYTKGGFHPWFNKPDYYPDVPRLDMDFRIDNNTQARAEVYYAICGYGIMAGGVLNVSFESGKLWANFEVEANLLLGFAPFHYDIDIRALVSAGFGSLGPVEVGVDVRIFGPDFGGYLRVKIVIVTKTIKFGDQGSTSAKPIDWDNFQQSFLPEAQDVCSITAVDGLVKQVVVDQKEVWVINPTLFELTTDSLIPAKQAFKGEDKHPLKTNINFGINSMGIGHTTLETCHKVTIEKNPGDSPENVVEKFRFEPISKLASIATWGEPRMSNGRIKPPNVNQEQFIDNVFFGFRILPAEPPKGGKSHEIAVENLQYEPVAIDERYSWESLVQFVPNSAYNTEEKRRDRIQQTVQTNPDRDAILQALGFDKSEVSINEEEVAESFVFAPQVK